MMTTRTVIPTRPGVTGGAFTLIELLVVITIIALALGLALPTMTEMFAQSTDEQARNVLRAMLGSARAAAIENQRYTAVHLQIGKDKRCWAVVLAGEINPADGKVTFVRLEGYTPQQMPGNIVFGEIPNEYDNHPVLGGTKPWLYEHHRAWKGNVNNAVADFTEVTIAFSPKGMVVTHVNGAGVVIYEDPLLFGAAEQAVWPAFVNAANVWDGNPRPAVREPAVRAVTFFDYKAVRDGANLANYLMEHGQWLLLNAYTGQAMEEI